MHVRTVNNAFISSEGESDFNCSAYCTESNTQIRSQCVPEEFKGNADVFPEHKEVLHMDHMVVIFWILVP